MEPQICEPHRDVQQLARRARHRADVPRLLAQHHRPRRAAAGGRPHHRRKAGLSGNLDGSDIREAAGRGDCCCALLQRRRGHDDRREPRSRVLRAEGRHEPVCIRDVHSEEREKRGGREEVHQLHVLDRGGDGELGIHRLFQSAHGRIRTARRGDQKQSAVLPGHERLSHRGLHEPSEGHFAVL